MTVRRALGASLAIVAVGLAASVGSWSHGEAQESALRLDQVGRGAVRLDPRRRSLRGAAPVALRTGFVPDPVVFRGEVVPARPLSELSQDCVGMGARSPSHVLELTSRFGFLRVFVTSIEDLTLAVRTEDGAVLCSDDRFGHHPAVEGQFRPGRLEVFVGMHPRGSTRDGGGADAGVDALPTYELEVTETRSIRPGVRRGEDQDRLALAVESGLDVRPETGRHRDIRLRRGFLPDPRFLDGNTGGGGVTEVELATVGDTCHGFVPATPSHVVTLLDEFDFFQIYIAEAAERTTLVVVGPDGALHCDSANSDHANVAGASWPPGLYRVWVGAERSDAAFDYRLGVSEVRRAR